jgi:hypothetical protein
MGGPAETGGGDAGAGQGGDGAADRDPDAAIAANTGSAVRWQLQLPRASERAAARPGLPSVRLRWLIITLAVMAALTVVWPLINLAVSSHRRVRAHSSLTVGPGGQHSASITVGPGWTEDARTNPQRMYVLRRSSVTGSVTLTFAYATLLDRGEVPALWTGLRRIIRLRYPGLTLQRPLTITDARNQTGQVGLATGPTLAGAAAIFPDPRLGFAIEMLIVAPRSVSRTEVAAARRILRSLVLSPGHGGTTGP